jgi:exopolysaccharide biosynthesis WecB/TagA/CpsF family protein
VPKGSLRKLGVCSYASGGPCQTVRISLQGPNHVTGLQAPVPTSHADDEDALKDSGSHRHEQVVLGGADVDLMGFDYLIDTFSSHLEHHDGAPLAIASANLDHIHHFGIGAPHADVMTTKDVNWLVLLDGAPLVRRAHALTNQTWPLLAGSDLLEPILDRCAEHSASVAFFGGSAVTHERLASILPARWPNIRVAGLWAPSRADIESPLSAAQLAREVAATAPDLVIVSLGKPRQEKWISEYGVLTGASVLLAFGASADFLAGTANRAPKVFRALGIEWSYRLMREPRRLFRRYCIEGPPAVRALREHSSVIQTDLVAAATTANGNQ